jgi:hypothetical protein
MNWIRLIETILLITHRPKKKYALSEDKVQGDKTRIFIARKGIEKERALEALKCSQLKKEEQQQSGFLNCLPAYYVVLK